MRTIYSCVYNRKKLYVLPHGTLSLLNFFAPFSSQSAMSITKDFVHRIAVLRARVGLTPKVMYIIKYLTSNSPVFPCCSYFFFFCFF